MKKFKVEISFVLCVLLCVVGNKFILLINYIFALLLHELAHLFVALKHGYTLKEFKLSMFGVAVELGEKIDDKDSFIINLSGPVFNLFLSLICVAFYWFLPSSYYVLNSFCVANLTLAIFNLLPIYPLDGGKIFCSILGIKKQKIVQKFICFSLFVLSIVLFIKSCFVKINFVFLLLALFFATTKLNHENDMSLLKFSKNKHIEKVELLKINGNETLFELLKKIQSRKYTIFYLNIETSRYIDEDQIINLATKYPLSTKIGAIA